MTEAERIARGNRAKAFWDEFAEPMLGELRDAYAERMVNVANDELNGQKRADKLTALSNAIRILSNLESGMRAIVTDGEQAQREKVRAESIEKMTAPQRRLLGIAPY